MGTMTSIEKNLDDSRIPLIELRDGYSIPQLGLGVFQLHGETCYNSVRAALEAGYRHIDTAAVYGNEEEVGRAISDAIAAGDVTREELFITTKLWNDSHDRVRDAFHESLTKLGLDYVDLYLLHWPLEKLGQYGGAYRKMLELRAEQKTASVGVCNCYPEVLDDITSATGDTPVVNQIEVHPGFSQEALRADNSRRGIITEAWSPLAAGQNFDAGDIHSELKRIADNHGVTVGQAIIRWHIQRGDIVIPRSSNLGRIAENADVFGFELTDEEVAQIVRLNRSTGRRGPDPLTFYAGTELEDAK